MSTFRHTISSGLASGPHAFYTWRTQPLVIINQAHHFFTSPQQHKGQPGETSHSCCIVRQAYLDDWLPTLLTQKCVDYPGPPRSPHTSRNRGSMLNLGNEMRDDQQAVADMLDRAQEVARPLVECTCNPAGSWRPELELASVITSPIHWKGLELILAELS